jgi:hypothetical protein
VPFGRESFAFPIHIEQVYYANEREEPSWRVVLRKEVRGRQITREVHEAEEEGLFAMGRDADHAGLPVEVVIPEEIRPRAQTGRNIRREDIFGDTGEDWEFLERDVGESSSSLEDELL